MDIAQAWSLENQCKEVIALCAKHKIGHVFVEENFSSTLANELRRVARELKLAINDYSNCQF